jgi:hypothetical protein
MGEKVASEGVTIVDGWSDR